jgi:PAS domain S-box-containing protein
MARMLELNLLGGFSASVNGRPLRIAARKDRALLAYLALSPGRRHARDRLAGLLWSEVEADARHNLRQALSMLTRTLSSAHARAGRLLQVDRDEVGLDSRPVEVDALRLRALLQSNSPGRLETASALYSGPLLDGLGRVSPAFDDWLTLERGRLAAGMLASHRRLLDLCAAAGTPERAIAAASRLVEADPLHEDARCELMLLYAECGYNQAAIEQYEAYAVLVRETLGAEPGEAAKQLHKVLLDGRTPPRGRARPALPARTPPSDPQTDGVLNRYAFVLEQMPDCVVITDMRGRIVGWNQWAKRNFGYDRREVLGRKPVFLYGPGADESVTMGLIDKAVRFGRWSGVLRLYNKDGSSRLHKRTMMPLRDEAGRVVGVFGVTRPLTRPIPGL